jgi:hypothetical protein
VPALAVGDQCEVVAQNVGGEAGVLGIPGALVFVDEDRSGKRELLDPEKRIQGKEKPALDADLEIAQARPAGTVAGGDLGVNGMPIARRLARLADLSGELFADGQHAVRDHCVLPRPETRPRVGRLQAGGELVDKSN